VLTKEAGAVDWLAGKAVRGVGGALKRVGRFAVENPRLTLAGVAGGSAGAVTAAEGIRRSQIGLSPQWQAARRAGYVQDSMPRSSYSRFNFLKNRRELARQMRIL